MSRILTLSPSMTLLELQNNVLDEFFPNTQTRPEASLSYWPPNSKELATGISTPPVMLTHDGSVSFFYRHFEVQKAMNLFVTFNHLSDPVHTSQVAENLFPFTTPDQPITKPPHLLNRYSGPPSPMYTLIRWTQAHLNQFPQPPHHTEGIHMDNPLHLQPEHNARQIHMDNLILLPPAPKKKKLVPNKCGRCGGTGHNRTNCVLPI
ncbi:unnamed protein product [Brassica rapa]|uniref:Uncharacterized protein n=1 Tax=Brassica campestris TaxID=3711 RepID=A0A8D9GXX8_BRACM|nr:unnamed protein product [Brassica rapa]